MIKEIELNKGVKVIAGDNIVNRCSYVTFVFVGGSSKAKEFPVKIHIYDDLKAVQPDILVDNHPQDLINGVDTQLEAVKKYIEKDLNLSLNC